MDIRNVLYMAGMVILTAMVFVAVLTHRRPEATEPDERLRCPRFQSDGNALQSRETIGL